jgi:thymidylate synthase (FAD)
LNIVQPYSRLINFDDAGNQVEFTQQTGIGLLRKIEWNARISHGSEDAQTPDSYKRFIQFVVMEKGDWSVVEHATATVDTLIDRGISHEWVRHRLCSFTQSSTRFINYVKKMPPSFISPFTGEAGEVGAEAAWLCAIEDAEKWYRKLIAEGCAPQIARSVFPNGLATRISTTCNLRNWRHLLLMRTSKEAHPQFRQVSIPLLAEFQAKIPLLYDDIVPLSRQIDNMRLPR